MAVNPTSHFALDGTKSSFCPMFRETDLHIKTNFEDKVFSCKCYFVE